MKRHAAVCLLMALAMSLGVFQAACAQEVQEVPQLLEPVSVQLDTFAARVGDISKISMYDATVVPYVEELYFSREGMVSEMHVVIGQEVSKGDLLISLNQEDQLEELESLKKQIDSLETDAYYDEQLVAIDLAILEVELRALESQREPDEGAIALKKLEMEELRLNKELEASVRDMQLSQLKTKLAALEEELSQNALYAPFDGRIMHMKDLARGSYVSAYTPLVFLADDSRLSIRSKYISGFNLSVAHDVYALIGDKRYQITPVEMNPQEYVSIVLAGETPMTEFIMEDAQGVTAGMYAGVCVESQYVEDALLVPSNSLYLGDGVRYLYVIEDGVRVRRDVKTGVANDIMTQIKEGLEEGEIVHVKE